MSNYLFYTTCVNPDLVGEHGECISEMTQSPHCEDVDSLDFMLNISRQHGFQDGLAEMFNHESLEDAANDWALSCHRSRFQGQPCFYVRHSGIEHIFVDERFLKNLVHGGLLQDRLATIESLDEQLDEYAPWQDASTPDEQLRALTDFIEKNYETFVTNNILLGSLFAYGNSFHSMVRHLDNTLLLNPSSVSQTIVFNAHCELPIYGEQGHPHAFTGQMRYLVEGYLQQTYQNSSIQVKSEYTVLDDQNIQIKLSTHNQLMPELLKHASKAVHSYARGITFSEISVNLAVTPGVPLGTLPAKPNEDAPTHLLRPKY